MDKIRIDAFDYEIVFKDSTCDELVVENMTCKGSIHYETKQIFISTKFPEQCQRQTLFHEIMHALIHERSINPKETDIETFVDEMAKGVIQLIRDNPLLFTEVNENGS